jgi:hypothetical protein
MEGKANIPHWQLRTSSMKDKQYHSLNWVEDNNPCILQDKIQWFRTIMMARWHLTMDGSWQWTVLDNGRFLTMDGSWQWTVLDNGRFLTMDCTVITTFVSLFSEELINGDPKANWLTRSVLLEKEQVFFLWVLGLCTNVSIRGLGAGVPWISKLWNMRLYTYHSDQDVSKMQRLGC